MLPCSYISEKYFSGTCGRNTGVFNLPSQVLAPPPTIQSNRTRYRPIPPQTLGPRQISSMYTYRRKLAIATKYELSDCIPTSRSTALVPGGSPRRRRLPLCINQSICALVCGSGTPPSQKNRSFVLANGAFLTIGSKENTLRGQFITATAELAL